MTISFVFDVTSRTMTPLPVQLIGTSDAPFHLQTLQIVKFGTDRTISKSATLDSIMVSTAEFDSLTNTATPFSVTFTGNDNTTSMTVTSISVTPGTQRVARAHSDITDLRGAPPATGTEDA